MPRFKIERTFEAVETFEVDAPDAGAAREMWEGDEAGDPTDTYWGDTTNVNVEEITDPEPDDEDNSCDLCEGDPCECGEVDELLSEAIASESEAIATEDCCPECHADWKAPHADECSKRDPEAYPVHAGEWQLYSGMEGTYEAAKELTEALRMAVLWTRSRIDAAVRAGEADPTARLAQEAYYMVWIPVANKHAKLGARDTEPETVAVIALEKRLGLSDQALHR